MSEFRPAPGFWGRSEPFILGGECVGSFAFSGSLGSLSFGFGPLPSILGPEIFHLGREGVAGRGEVRCSCVEGVEGRGVFVSDEVDNRGQVTGRERFRCAVCDSLTGVCSGVRYVEYGRVGDE